MRKLIIVLIAAIATSITTAMAQVYPSRPVTIMVPVPPASATDTVARVLAERMRISLGQPVIIENITGAGGTLGVGRVARAVPDGYTLGIGSWLTHVANGAVYDLSYDLSKGFEPISLLTNSPIWIVARSNFPPKDAKELIAWLQANPDKASAATIGPGSAAHISCAYFQKYTGTRFGLVPYRGGGPALQDLVAQHIDFMCSETSSSLSYVRSGRLKAYAVMAMQRWSAAPEVPTIDEAGLPGLYTSLWHGLWAPKGTPAAAIDRLNAAVVDAMSDRSVNQRFSELGIEIFPRDQQTPAALRSFQAAEITKWWPIIRALNIKLEERPH